MNHPNIKVPPPGPKAKELVERDHNVISSSYGRWYPLVVERAEDCIIWDVDGNSYIDFNSGLVVMNVGHNHPRIVKAVKEQVEKLIHYSNTDFYYREAIELAEELTKITPGNFPKKVFFGNSGAEAVEAAIKAIKWHTRRPRIIGYIGAFHGRTMGALSITASKPIYRDHFFPMMPGVTHVPFPYCYRCPFKMEYPSCGLYCVDFIEEQVLNKYIPPDEVGAFFFEPIQGEGGYVVPPPKYFQKLKKLADKYDIKIVSDEVQAGMGRAGKWFAIEHWSVEPDVISSAKGIASGFPLGAMISRAELQEWDKGAHASTFGGNPVSARVALEVIRIIKEEKLLDNATKVGEHIMKRLNEFKDDYAVVGDVRGKGLMIGMELVKNKETKEPAKEIAHDVMIDSWKNGVAVITAGISTIRIAPPLTITSELADKALDIIENSIKKVMKEREVK